MNSVMHPRGRLPARVYWFRRSMVVLAAALLVFGVAKAFGGGGGPERPPAASLAAAPESSAPPRPAIQGPQALPTGHPPEGDEKAKGDKKKHHKKKNKDKDNSPDATETPADLATPSGPCDPADLAVQPTLDKAAAGGDVPLTLQLTGTSAACTFKVSPESLVVKLTSGKDRIWSSQDCPRSIPTRQVVVRSAQPAELTVTWDGHRSTPDSCGGANAWAQPGYYHAHAAVLGSVPSDQQFRLTVPPRAVVTRTTSPKPERQSDKVRGKQSACGGDNAC